MLEKYFVMFDSKPNNLISEVTRRVIIDYLILTPISWSGRLQENDFLSRMFPVSNLPSFDGRFSNAYGDISQHRIFNSDWEADWVFTDSRFNILNGSDEVFMKFLCETIHPAVRVNSSEVAAMLKEYNRFLLNDGWEVYEASRISGHPIYGAREIGVPQVIEAQDLMDIIDKSYISHHIKRMNEALRLSDSEQAIGSAKEFLETICKYTLSEMNIGVNGDEDIPTLVRLTCKALKLVPDAVPDSIDGKDKVKRLLMNVASIGQSCAELRNIWGTGHGKSADFELPYPRLARLAVNAAITLGVFLFETLQEQKFQTSSVEYLLEDDDLDLDI
jgi:hypothetical protein